MSTLQKVRYKLKIHCHFCRGKIGKTKIILTKSKESKRPNLFRKSKELKSIFNCLRDDRAVEDFTAESKPDSNDKQVSRLPFVVWEIINF